MNDEMKTTTEVSGPWECFSDPSYYDMARLRRKDGPKDFNTGFHLNTLREAQELRNILNSYEARLALVPEEAVVVNPEPSSSVVDQKPDNMSYKHEWRELGPDEEICEGDEKFVGRGPWLTQAMYIGEKAGKYPLIRFRTRRPLPVQEMPLEDEIVRLQEVGRLNYAEGQQDLTDCLRYLRDEIQKLKEAKP